MRVLIDPQGAEAFSFRTSTTEYGDLRRYYCAGAPWRAILVTRNGLDLHESRGQVVDARVGYEAAWREFARPGAEGLRHTKITLYRILPQGRPDTTLSRILSESEKDT